MVETVIGVWWDINTCPVPDGYDTGFVRKAIQHALRRRCCNRTPITIFCVGNLVNISSKTLEEISASGILLRHVPPFGWSVLADHLLEWKKRNLPLAYIMLISGDISWFTGSWFRSSILSLKFRILRAFPAPRPPGYPSLKEWVWEDLFLQGKEYDSLPNSLTPPLQGEHEHALFCTLCQIPIQSVHGFLDHLHSREHACELAQSVLAFVDENNDVIHHCKLFDYPGFDESNMTIPWTGGDLSQNVSCLSLRTFPHRLNQISFIPRGFDRETGEWCDINNCINTHPVPRGCKKTVGVWWDINTCPIPDGYDPGLVRGCIESALMEYLGHVCPVTIFCVGNLEAISPEVLKEIYSSGILLRNDISSFDGVWSTLNEWEKLIPNPAKIMLISGDSSWCSYSLFSPGFTVLRAFPKSLSFSSCTFTKAWAWESLLEKGSSLEYSTNKSPLRSQFFPVCKDTRLWGWETSVVDNVFFVEPKHGLASYFCTLCNRPIPTFELFICHLRFLCRSRSLV